MTLADEAQDNFEQDEIMKDIISKRKKKMTVYLEGFEAYFDGKKLRNNPHPLREDDFYKWAEGYLDAEEKDREK